MLQRGRAFWGAEIRVTEAGLMDVTMASTGPRLLGRGDAAKKTRRAQKAAGLQRGRAFWGAEIRPGCVDFVDR
ncbi:MAG: hypothetical protein RLZZ179_2167 [Verrucomicrobiota bacterium]